MKILGRRLRAFLCATTALTLAAGLAKAQTAPAPASQALNLGSVVANGGSGAVVAPSGTGTLAQAQKLKKLAPNIVTVQPASQIQKLPDNNLAEALQRLPGISMESDTGAGRFINIRGLDADLNGTSYDGVHLTAANQSTPTGGARAVAFDAFPTGMVGGVEIVKSLTPDIDAEGLGGSINLLPLSLPVDGGPLVEISQAGGEETLRRTGVFQSDVTLGDSFAIPGMRSFANARPFSIIANYTYHSDRRGIDDVEEDYTGPTDGPGTAPVQDLQFRHYDGHRVTTGFGTELDFDPSPTTHLYIRGMQGGYDEQLDKNRLELDGLDGSNGTLTDNGGGSYTATGATAQKDYTNSNERIVYDLAAVGGRTVVDNALNVDFRGSWTQGLDLVTDSYGTKFKDPTPFNVTYSTASAAYRSYSTPGVDLSNPALYDLHSVSNTPGRNIDEEFGAATDASFADNIFGYLGEGKFGFDARFRTEGSLQSEYDYNNLPGDTLAQLDQGNPNVTYYNNHYTIGPDVAYEPLFGAIGAPTAAPETTVSSFAHNTENVYAAYAMETVEFGQLEVLGGARVEDTNATYRANLAVSGLGGPTAGAIYFAGDDTNYTPNSNKQDYINVFPALQFKYTVNDKLQLRAAYSTGIARPGFQQVSAATTVVVGGASNGQNSVTEGNPNIKPTTENSFDLTAEYYTDHGGLLSVNPFYKFFNDYTVSTQAEGTYQGQPAQINSYQNIGGAFVRGVELDAQQKLAFLPAPLDGFGVDGNVTLVDSRGRYDTNANNQPLKANQLPETSPVNYNAALFYENGPASFRIAASYVSRNLFTVVAGGRDQDQFSSPRFRLDMSASYQVTPQWQVYAEGKNLTNTLLEFTQSASSAYPIQREFYDSDYIVGVRFNLGGAASHGSSDD